jgi:L-seryl-tRNA(Ser) seleniumtransferase
MRFPLLDRRHFFTWSGVPAALETRLGSRQLLAVSPAGGVYTRLGLRPIINASGTYTHLGGSLMPAEVLDAMNNAARASVPIRDLTRAVGEPHRTTYGNEAALMTTGAAGAIFVGTRACIAGADPNRMKHLPFTDGMKNEVVVQNLHNTGWTRQCEAGGARMVGVEYPEQMQRHRRQDRHDLLSSGRQTLRHVSRPVERPRRQVSLEQCAAIAKKARSPLLVDAAAELPPNENLSGYTKQSADLVAFSGGKGLRGPQNAGLLVDRKDLVEAAALYQSPYSGIGRDLKISKETMIGMLAGVERYTKLDHAAAWNKWKMQVDYVKTAMDSIPVGESAYVPKEVTNHVPRLYVKWDEKAFNLSREDCFKVQEGEPSIVAMRTPR